MVVDLVDLPAVNERDGFAAGDRLLVEAATALRRTQAAPGGVACRLGGRTLALPVPGTLTGADAHVAGEIGDLGEVSAVTWKEGETGYEPLARAQKTRKASRATGTAGSV